MPTPVWPRRVASSSEGAQAARIKNLERRLGILERNNAAGIQRYSSHPADQNLTSTPVTLDSITLNIPNATSRVLIWFNVSLICGAAGTAEIIYVADEIDFMAATNAFILANHTGTTLTDYYPRIPAQVGAAGKVYELPLATMMYGSPTGSGSGGPYPPAPTPGDHTFSLKGERSLGVSNINFRNIYWWIAVI